MIFPQDINKIITDSKKVAGDNKRYAVVFVAVISAVIIFVATDYLMRNFVGAPLIATIGVCLVIYAIAGVLAFRFLIFDEDEKKKEYESAESDSFAKYMWLRKDNYTEQLVAENPVTIFEYVNGSLLCVLEMRFGNNNNELATNSYNLYEKLTSIVIGNNLEARWVIGPENFRSSKEFRDQIAAINRIKDQRAAKNVTMINDAIIDHSMQYCNVDIVYFMIRTMNNHQKTDLEVALKRIFNELKNGFTAFRSIHFLNIEELMEFYREFYGIAAIDLSMMRTIELAETLTDEFDSLVSLLQLSSSTGKVYADSGDIISVSERKVN